MEIIKKKISLEKFKSRIPTLLDSIECDRRTEEKYNSWGKSPKKFQILENNMRYREIVNLYYMLLNTIKESVYYRLDGSGGKWIEIKNFDWRDMYYYGVMDEDISLKYYTDFPDTLNRLDNEIIGITTNDGSYIMNDLASSFKGGNHQGIKLFSELNNILGIEIVPTIYEGIYVPKIIYISLIDEYINKLTSFTKNTCCNRKLYEEYGGDSFKTYLVSINDNINNYGINDITKIIMPTIEIPILLTSKLVDLGQYRTHDVDITYESSLMDLNNDNDTQTTNLEENISHSFIQTKGESKLLTLRKRRRTLTDDNIELPFILTKYVPQSTNETTNKETITMVDNKGGNVTYEKEDIFQVGYVKNIEEYGGNYYGDTIQSITENLSVKETDKEQYDNFKRILIESNNSSCIKEGTTEKNENNTGSKYFELNNDEFNVEYKPDGIYDNEKSAENVYLNKFKEQIDIIVNKLLLKASKTNDKYVCFKQDYTFKYKINYYTDKNNNRRSTFEKHESGSIYVISYDYSTTFTYVIGGKLSISGIDNSLQLSESYPSGDTWNGCGVWYQETYPKKVLCSIENVALDNKIFNKLFYDEIDIPKNKHILCENVRYKPDMYKEIATNDAIIKDEKMLGINSLKESYDVAIDRGSSAAFEKHLQLSEIKTWKDLENYRNGMFLNK